MTVAVDTNIVAYLLSGNSRYSRPVERALSRIRNSGAILGICAPVYAELLAVPNLSQRSLDEFLNDAALRVDWTLPPRLWVTAGVAFALFAKRRMRSEAAQRRRLPADFLIGAHAASCGALLTADAKFYRTNFPTLSVLDI